MKSIPNTVFLQELKSQTSKHIEQIKVFKDLDEGLLTAKIDINSWNIVECLEHLNTYSNYYLPEISKKLDNANTKSAQSFKSGWLGNYFVNMMNPENGNKKYKAAPKHVPVNSNPPHNVINEFIKNQESLLEYLVQAENVNLKNRIPISINYLIKLKLGDVFSFLVMHNERHIQQAIKVKANF